MNQPSVFRVGTDEYHHQFKSLRAIREALAIGADPEEHNALHLAVQLDRRGNAKCSEIVEELLRFGADVNSRNIRGQTPLHVSNHEHVEKLVNQGADLNARDRMGRSCLHQEGSFINLQKSELLLKAGIDANARDNDGNTTLHFCESYFRSHVELTELLLKHGADPTIRNDIGQTAYQTTGLELLRQAGNAKRAEQCKASLLEGLGTTWKPSDCKADAITQVQATPSQQQRRRLM